jgi:hypothetical protein
LDFFPEGVKQQPLPFCYFVSLHPTRWAASSGKRSYALEVIISLAWRRDNEESPLFFSYLKFRKHLLLDSMKCGTEKERQQF